MKTTAPNVEPQKIIQSGLCQLALSHKPGSCTQTPLRASARGVYFLCLPCQLERSFGRLVRVTHERRDNSYQKTHYKPLRFDSAALRGGACGGRHLKSKGRNNIPSLFLFRAPVELALTLDRLCCEGINTERSMILSLDFGGCAKRELRAKDGSAALGGCTLRRLPSTCDCSDKQGHIKTRTALLYE